MDKLTEELWLQKCWRPLMSIVYSAICLADFVVLPIFWSLIQAYFHGTVQTQWVPVTLSMGGFIHISFGSVIGISAWTRGKEKQLRITTSETK